MQEHFQKLTAWTAKNVWAKRLRHTKQPIQLIGLQFNIYCLKEFFQYQGSKVNSQMKKEA